MAPVERHLVLTEMVDRWLLSVYADGAHLRCEGLVMSWCIFCALAPPPRHVLLNTRSCRVSSAPGQRVSSSAGDNSDPSHVGQGLPS